MSICVLACLAGGQLSSYSVLNCLFSSVDEKISSSSYFTVYPCVPSNVPLSSVQTCSFVFLNFKQHLIHNHLLGVASSIRGFVGELSSSESSCEAKCPLQSHSWPRGLNIDESEAYCKTGQGKNIDLNKTTEVCCVKR